MTETATLTDFLLDRIAEDAAVAWRSTVVVSGGTPAPEVPNCVGAEGSGCPERWRFEQPSDAVPGWWRTPEVQAAIRVHEGTHQTPATTRVLAECEAKRLVVRMFGFEIQQERGPGLPRHYAEQTLRLLGEVYADHPDYREEWKP